MKDGRVAVKVRVQHRGPGVGEGKHGLGALELGRHVEQPPAAAVVRVDDPRRLGYQLANGQPVPDALVDEPRPRLDHRAHHRAGEAGGDALVV